MGGLEGGRLRRYRGEGGKGVREGGTQTRLEVQKVPRSHFHKHSLCLVATDPWVRTRSCTAIVTDSTAHREAWHRVRNQWHSRYKVYWKGGFFCLISASRGLATRSCTYCSSAA
eukprot:25292-Rhodomonas_salina.4